jgi:hypothetical protein
MKFQATYVSADDFDVQYFQISFDAEAPSSALEPLAFFEAPARSAALGIN